MATLAPHLANGIIIQLTHKDVLELNRLSDEAVKNDDFKLLDLLHHLTSGLKAWCSEA